MNRRLGFTLLELFVVIAVIGVLMSLLAPAIGAAIEAARATRCLSNLRQIGLATHQYEGVHKMFPGWRQISGGTSRIPPSDHIPNDCSIQAQLLPFLDQSAFFDELNLSKCRIPAEQERTAPEWSMLSTVLNRRLAVFLCPSDSGDLSPGCNYRACLGSGPSLKFSGEFFDSGNGFFSPLFDQPGGEFPIRTSAITDGLAQTAMFSERVRGSGDDFRFDATRDSTNLLTEPTTAGPTIVYCRWQDERARQGTWGWNPWLGRMWVVTSLTQTLYNHVMPPNSSIADCLEPGGDPTGTMTARSLHPGGVNVLFGDGSTRFVQNDVNLAVWRAISTRNGNETVLIGSY